MIKLTAANYRQLIDYYQYFDSEVSDTSLYNLLLWNEKYDFYFDIIGKALFIINQSSHGLYYSEPIGDLTDNEKVDAVIALKNKVAPMSTLVLKKANYAFGQLLLSKGLPVKLSSKRDDEDYLYLKESLELLKGKKYHKKKNHVNQFLKKYDDYRFTLNHEEYSYEIDQFLRRWYEGKENNDLEIEHRGIQVLLSVASDALSVGMLWVKNQLVGLSIIEYLQNGTIIVHVEKADTTYKGAYSMLFHMTVLHAKKGEWLNREQDLGNEGLRKSKLSYHPDRMVKKCRIDFH